MKSPDNDYFDLNPFALLCLIIGMRKGDAMKTGFWEGGGGMTAQSSQSVHHDQRTSTACRICQILDVTSKTVMADTINERK